MKQRTLSLTAEERHYLERLRARDRRTYIRERAAALLKIAAGQSAHQVALHGLLQRRRPETVYGWLNYWEKHHDIAVRPPTRRSFSP